MPKSVPADLFRSHMRYHATHVGVVLPTLTALICFFSQLIFTDYFKGSNVTHLYYVAAALVILMLTQVYNKKPSFRFKAMQSAAHYIVAFYAIGVLLPIPSPYLLFIMVLATIDYFNLGMRPMLIGLFGMFVAVTTSFLVRYGVSDIELTSIYFATYLITLVVTYYSITFLKVAEKELTVVAASTEAAVAQQKQMESLINNINDGVIAVDKHLKVSVYNAAAIDVLDLNTDIKGKTLDKLLKPIDKDSKPVSISELLHETTAPAINRDLRLKYADGSVANLFLGIAPIYLGYGKSTNNGFTLVLRDITREKSLEEERDEFISVVSHELRTPIAISEGNISNAEFIVEKTGDMKAVKTALKEAHHQVLFLADMINDLSTLSRAERGVLQVDVEAINVVELCTELGQNYNPQAETKGLKFITEIDPKLELLHTSKLYSREILQNFITNAIKYTEKGQVILRAVPDPKGVRFSVTDTGIGISKSDQERVYDKFFRSEDFRTRQNNGTGLGLYVTMKLARLIHAEISLSSELNKGSVFSIFIPNIESTEPKRSKSTS